MIKKLWRWLSQKFTTKPRNFIYIGVNQDGTLDLDAGWELGKELMLAELIYFVNSGILLTPIVEALGTVSSENNTQESYNKMMLALLTLYKTDQQAELVEQQTDDDSPIINPSEVFDHSKNEE